MTGVAVNVTLVPAQMVSLGLTVMLTAVATVGFTVMVSVLLVAVLPVTQLKDVVTTQVTSAPFASPDELYVGELLPTGDPPTNH